MKKRIGEGWDLIILDINPFKQEKESGVIIEIY